jgi:hypothetical protein
MPTRGALSYVHTRLFIHIGAIAHQKLGKTKYRSVLRIVKRTQILMSLYRYLNLANVGVEENGSRYMPLRGDDETIVGIWIQ